MDDSLTGKPEHVRVVPPTLAGYTCADPLYGCWLWTGRLDKDGYGRWPGGRLAHIVAYEAAHGPVPEGKSLDHLCRRRACVRPEHLEPVTRSEQERRKYWRYRSRTMRRCSEGHDLRLQGRLTPEGGRICRVCCGV